MGLIGGSIGLAVKKKGLFAEVRGTTRRQQTLEAALAAGAIDSAFLDPLEAARGADGGVVATTGSTIAKYCLECAAVAREGALVTDVGSVKARIDAAVRPKMPKGRYFIGSHPMAGSEKTGVVNARADLLAGATCIVTPVGDSDDWHYRMLSEFWQSLGMNVFKMSPDQHDWVVANISHLPHMLAAALVAAVPDGALPFGATGFRDTSRVAGGDPAIWREIAEANSGEILQAMKRFEAEMETIKALILRSDFQGLEDYLRNASDRRRKRFDGAQS